MLRRPQEGNEAVLIMGLAEPRWQILFSNHLYQLKWEIGIILRVILAMAVFVTWSWHPRQPKQWHMRALAIPYVLAAATELVVALWLISMKPPQTQLILVSILPIMIEAVAVLMLNMRPRRIANLTSTPCGRKLISLAKVTSASFMVG